MEYRSLGRTGIQVSELCLGTMNFGSSTDETESIKIIEAAIEAGINFIDTANCYGQGRSEEIVGRALKQNGHLRPGKLLSLCGFRDGSPGYDIHRIICG
jgi:aryl-alcohol dehydrogenase-like predicted oxidoreductase